MVLPLVLAEIGFGSLSIDWTPVDAYMFFRKADAFFDRPLHNTGVDANTAAKYISLTDLYLFFHNRNGVTACRIFGLRVPGCSANLASRRIG